ncbi:MAG TPA: hypothetical protein PKC12_03965 [Thiobacillaceae bacterium]|nr:hypothetical protein [Thiobacillaceae bacterium]
MTVRSVGKKIALGFAVACLLCTVASLGSLIYLAGDRGMQDVWSASALATTFFFASCTLVLFLMSKPPRHVLLPWHADDTGSHEASAGERP